MSEERQSLFLVRLVTGVIGFISGVLIQINYFANNPYILNKFSSTEIINCLVITGAAVGLILFLVRLLTERTLQRAKFRQSLKREFLKKDLLTYLIFILPFLGALGLQTELPFMMLMVLLFLAAKAILFFSLLAEDEKQQIFISLRWLSFLFLLSGCSAVIYQICWHRVLYLAYGVNIESVTVIVSVFMFGLGLGSLLGGFLSERFSTALPKLFCFCEIAIGLFGVFSLPLIQLVSTDAIHSSFIGMLFGVFALLVVPTLLMGATLPILVAYVNQRLEHVGQSVALLYFYNTLGSAIFALVTVCFLFAYFGMQTTVVIAAMINFIVAFLVASFCRRVEGSRAK